MATTPPPGKAPIITGPSRPVVTDKPKSRQQKRWRHINKLREQAHGARN